MKRPAFLVVVAVAAALASAVGCKKKEPEQPQPLAPMTPYPTATAPVATGVAPMPFSPACQQLEGTCGWARCNMTAGRCAFPCASDADCIQGARCLAAGPVAMCLSGFPGAAPAPTQPTM